MTGVGAPVDTGVCPPVWLCRCTLYTDMAHLHLKEDGQMCWDDKWEKRRQKYNLPPLYMEKVRRRLAARYGYRLREEPAPAPTHLPPLPPNGRTLSTATLEENTAVPVQQQVVEDDADPEDKEEVSSSVIFR
ncbi:Hypp3676 [Branchiostoma lanceolatum]|uniref:Hypp3676 protein n=1 Tax=Branchiostoma lanceolatum TaxID=7740 RepID=A0A8K0EV08_BRALA|nr:Hypp3676 [Branchiostoma lanceolatum]